MGYFARVVTGIITLCSLSGCQTIVERFVFEPEALEQQAPAGVDERWIVTADGVRLHAWHAAAARSRASVLWSHGRGGDVGEGADALRSFVAHGFDVLAYDYRGYGKSEGRPSEDGLYLDAEAAFDSETARGVPPQRIVCFGDSLGGAVSIHLATRRPCGAVAVVSTFTSLRDMEAVQFGLLSRLAPDQFNSEALVGTLRMPFFDAHGDTDLVVPYANGERLFAAASEPKVFVPVRGAGHDMLDEGPATDRVIGEMARFLLQQSEIGTFGVVPD